MKDFGPGAGQYASWKDDKEKRRLFMERLVNIVKTRVRHSFVNSVILADYRKVDELYPLSEMNKPFALAGSTCIEKVRRWARKWNIDESRVAYMFEDGDKDRGDLIRCAQRDHGVAVKLMKKSESVAFQAADLLAYEHRLANKRIYEAGVGTLGLTDLRSSLQALKDIPHGSDGEDWGVYDLESLTTQCMMNKYPLRSSFSA
ncbi:MAG: DUF3800 domain-containing protein [Terriglobales bacterium]